MLTICIKKLNLKIRKLLLKDRFFISVFIATIIIAIIRVYIPQNSIYESETINEKGIIKSYNIDGDKLSLNISSNEPLKCTYYFSSNDEKKYYSNILKEGISINFTALLSNTQNNTIPNTFNYKKYLYNHGIFYNCRIEKFSLGKVSSIFYKIKNLIIKRIDSFTNIKSYLYTFVIGNKNYMDEGVMNDYRKNGVTHLFAISGMHIGLFSGFILFILKKLKVKENKRYIATIIFIWLYAFLTAFSPSVLRSALLFTLICINKIFYLEVKTINILFLTGAILLSINPFLLVDIGFQYSFMTTFGLIYANTILTKHKIIGTSVVAFLISLPITINNFYNFNLLSLIINVLFVPIVSTIVYPMCLIALIFKFFEPVTNISINVLEWLNTTFSNIQIFKIVTPPLSIIGIIIYYSIFIILIKKNLMIAIISVCIFLIVNINYNFYSNGYSVDYLDVGQGDSTLITFPKNRAILIDTGGKITEKVSNWKKKKNYNITDNTIMYLYSLGISKIDYLILTHGDFDHMGEAINLVNNFKVEKVIFNCGPYNDLEKELIKVLENKKIRYYSCIKELNIDKNKLYFLQTKVYDNENDNSNVIYTELNGYKFMFMGDASITTEKEIMNKYNLSDIDALKVGHHGSKTSSGKEFIDEINPEYSIISVGKNNRYGHPNKEVLDNLENSKIYRTDQDGSIMFKIKNNKFKIETCSP